jgi:hypothetical protein
MYVSHDNQRGQTLPFWVIGVLVALSMMFFLANYANAVAWQIRAQNAADSAASAALGPQANVYNQYSTILYATAVDEYRIRAINQAILNTIYGDGGCSTNCDSDYLTLVTAYNNAVSAYTNDVNLLEQANNLSQASQNTDQSKSLSMIENGTWCGSDPNDYACSFKINVLNDASVTSTNGNGQNGGYIVGGDNEVDLLACRNISYFGAGLLGLSNTADFQVLGRAAAAIVPSDSESFDPGKQTNPQTGQLFQPVESSWATDAPAYPAYQVDFSGLTVNVNWYQAGAIHPYSTVSSSGFTCSGP